MAGKIKISIMPNGAILSDMSNFKNCKDKTKKLMEDLDINIDSMQLKEEEVQQNVNVNITVKR